MSKPSVIVLGGVGFIGRNFVQYLIDNDLAGKIRVADKALPQLAGLSAAHQAMFDGDKVEVKQAKLGSESSAKAVFADGPWDYCINLAAETKYSQTEEVYQESIIAVAKTCSAAAAAAGVKTWVEVSTAQVYDPKNKGASKETDKLKPWTKMATAKLAAEEAVKASGVEYMIVRPAIVYGPGDVTGITPRLITGATYTKLGSKMDFLWSKDLKINTVHVEDVVNALWHLCNNGTRGEIYNLADSNETTQGSVAKALEELYGIKTGFMGNLASKAVTSVAMKTVADTANDKHLTPWSDLCKEKNILNTKLTPYLDEELLYNNSTAVDGSKISGTSFEYKHPKMTVQKLKDSLQYFIDIGAFPEGVLK